MSVFDLDEDGETAIRQQALESGVDFNNVQPGFFDRTGYGIGMGLARGAAKVGRAVALAGSVPLTAYETAKGYQPGEITDSYFDTVVKPTDQAVEFYTPNANEVGTAGRVLGTLAEIVAPLAAGGGNPSLLIGSTALNTGVDLVQKGVDSTTATAVGLVDATAVGIGFKLPFLGKTFAQKAATGAGTNLALGIGATAADREILDARGYEELAQQYNPLDIEARTVDLLTGIAFGGLAQLQSRGRAAPEVARSERDAALAALNARNYQFDTAPGRPADESALAAHQRALEQSLKQLQEGQPVEVGASRVTEARFIDAPREASALGDSQVRAVLEELGIRDIEPVRDAPRAAEPDAIVDTQQSIGDGVRADELPPGRNVTPAETTAPREPQDQRQAGRDAPRAAPESTARDGERAEPDDPDVIAAERSVDDADILIDTGEVDAGGAAKTVSARESLAAARQEVAGAKREATALQAAVACALSFGD